MVFLNNTLGKRQPESPSSLLGGESWLEDSLEVLIGNALSCILDIDNPLPTAAKDGDGNASAASHCIDCILAQHLYHPFEQRST